MFERFTESARCTLFFARFEVSELGGVAIEAEHILLGILRASRRAEAASRLRINPVPPA